MKKRGLIMVVSGFAGCGKGTLVKKLISEYDNYALSVSMTTRNPRPGEENGREYFFVTKEEFETKIAENGFVEYARYVDNYYGTPKAWVEQQLDAGKNVILEIEIQGALKVKEAFPEALLIFILPPSGEELYKRLKNRGTETDEVIKKRMMRAVEEASGIHSYEYVVVNSDLDECTKQLHEIVSAASHTPQRNEAFIEQLRKELSDSWKGDL